MLRQPAEHLLVIVHGAVFGRLQQLVAGQPLRRQLQGFGDARIEHAAQAVERFGVIGI